MIEYFFAIQEDYLQLLDNGSSDYIELLNQVSPKVEILSHSDKETAVEAKINKQQVNYLLMI